MGGSSKQTSTMDSTTKTNPWEGTIPTLNNLIGQVGNQTINTNPTATEQGAIQGLAANAGAGNPYAPAINSLASNLLAGGGPDRSGYTTAGLSQLQSSLNPIANQNTDPYQNPAFQNLVHTLTNDTADQVKSAYAGAGYSPVATGDFAQQLGRGISQGVAPAFVQAQDTLTNQRANAANSLYQGGATTSGLLSGLDQTRLANQQAGVGASTAALNANDSPYLQQLKINQMQRQLPLGNIGNLESLIVPLAQLGGTSNTNATQTTEKQNNPGLLGAAMGIGSLFAGGPSSAFSGLLGGLTGGINALGKWSDRRMKDDIEQIGALYDGTPVYRFRYKGEARTQIGLMAQDVEKFAPEAVQEINGFKAVNYKIATDRAARAA